MSTAFLDEISVAKPCSAAWDDMSGNDRVRFCDHCQKHVYNLSALTRDDAASLVRSVEGKMCIRFFRRQDGTMLTEDCSVGLRAKTGRFAKKWMWAATALILLLFCSAAGAMVAGSSGRGNGLNMYDRVMAWLFPSRQIMPVMGEAPPVNAVMGKMCTPKAAQE